MKLRFLAWNQNLYWTWRNSKEISRETDTSTTYAFPSGWIRLHHSVDIAPTHCIRRVFTPCMVLSCLKPPWQDSAENSSSYTKLPTFSYYSIRVTCPKLVDSAHLTKHLFVSHGNSRLLLVPGLWVFGCSFFPGRSAFSTRLYQNTAGLRGS